MEIVLYLTRTDVQSIKVMKPKCLLLVHATIFIKLIWMSYQVKMCHVSCLNNLRLISKLVNNDLERGLPKISFNDILLCETCVKGKQVKSLFKIKNEISTQRPLKLIQTFLDQLELSLLAGKDMVLSLWMTLRDGHGSSFYDTRTILLRFYVIF